MNTARLYRDPVRYFRSCGVEIGEGVDIFGPRLFTFGSEPYLVSIGNQVTISHSVDFITHDGAVRVARAEFSGSLSLWANSGRGQLLPRCPFYPPAGGESWPRIDYRQWSDRHG